MGMQMSGGPRRAGFTLLELLVVIFIMLALTAIAVTSLRGFMDVERVKLAGTQVESGDLFALCLADRQNENRCAGPRSYLSNHVGAIHVRQAEVEQDDVWVTASEAEERFLSRRRRFHQVAMSAEISLHSLENAGVVIHDEDVGPCFTSHWARSEWSVRSVAGSASGRVKTNRAPPTGRFSAQMRPP